MRIAFMAKVAGAFGKMLSAVSPSVPTVDVSELTTSVSGFLSGNFNTQNLLIIIAAALGISIGLVLLWFGYGFIKRKLMGALRKGRL